MVTVGLLVRLDAEAGADDEVEEFLRSALPLVEHEPATTAWFAVRFGRSEYGIFDAFPDDRGLEAHLSGDVASALADRAPLFLSAAPRMQRLTIIAHKLPSGQRVERLTKGLLLTFDAKAGHEESVQRFLRDAEAFVREEEGTTAWFALRLGDAEFGIFDVFPDNGARFAHLVGHVPRELAKHALTLLGSVPELHLLDVLAAKIE